MKVGQSSEIFGSLQKRVFLRKPLERCQPYSFHNRLKVQKRGSSSHTNNNGEIVTAKGQTISLNKDSTTRVTSQFKTITTLFVELVKTNTPSFDLSLSSLAKRLPFQNVQTDIPKDNIANKKLEEKDGVEVKTGIPSYFDILGRKKEEKKEAAIPQWKIKRKAVSQESVDARTKHVVSAVAKAVTKSSLLVRLEDFCHHLFQYPAAKSVASREGAISILLRLKHSIPRDELIQRQIREGLALLGYADPLPAKGIRILSIDGGGTRGLLALRILRHLEKISGKPIYESFDYICGVSTGAVLALLIGAAKKNVKDVETMYREISTEVFKQDRSSGLGGLLWSHAYYDTSKWETILRDKIGETIMIRTAREPNCLKVSAISSIVSQEMLRPFVFRNYTLPFRVQSLYSGTFRHKMWEAVRASSAAPGYFGEFKLEENLHQDGGLFVNNPCAVAIHEAKCIWPNAKLLSVVSIGTGRCQPLNMAAGVNTSDPTNTSLKQKLSKVIDSATDTERVHTILHDLLPPKVYYRFNPYLSEIHSLDETDPARWESMLEDVEMYIRKNHRNMNQAASTLQMPRSSFQSAKDWVLEKRFLLQNKATF
ncbi:calcium-independent phospholipase A2-gamma-like isoform X2 [Daphnia pulex]|uniref:calcium-independent phospholipase A2-gamma-like isoform X2 n=1 Tax=Daphnia pulex TaxID=6669 RepID=UPI001EDF51BD|nr:calcium-independent phospholipase A2-gamma-like isoform X2 [Daphnia pulex]